MKLNKNDINSNDLFKLQRQARSKVKFDAIIEIIEGVSKTYNTEVLKIHMYNRGWECLGSGLYKECMTKDSIVFKFPINSINFDYCIMEIAREYEQWFNPPDFNFRRYLPRIYALVDNRILIQDRVILPCIKKFDVNCGINVCILKSKMDKIATRYNLEDYIGNHGHTSKGNVLFFDSVWERSKPIKL